MQKIGPNGDGKSAVIGSRDFNLYFYHPKYMLSKFKDIGTKSSNFMAKIQAFLSTHVKHANVPKPSVT